jgi:hypothetical protein
MEFRSGFDSLGDRVSYTWLRFRHIPDPLAPENLLKPSGHGIFVIRKYMDEVQFRNLNPGTEIILIRRVRGAAAVDLEEKAL